MSQGVEPFSKRLCSSVSTVLTVHHALSAVTGHADSQWFAIIGSQTQRHLRSERRFAYFRVAATSAPATSLHYHDLL